MPLMLLITQTLKVHVIYHLLPSLESLVFQSLPSLLLSLVSVDIVLDAVLLLVLLLPHWLNQSQLLPILLLILKSLRRMMKVGELRSFKESL